MPIKVYSDDQKEEIRLALLDTALKLYSQYGIKNVTLMSILKEVGISKPFFYTFYNSVQEFVVCALEHQWSKFPKILEDIDSQSYLNWEEKIYTFFKQATYYHGTGLLIMTQEEEVWVRERIDNKSYDIFMNNQFIFFENLLLRWGIPKGKCNPKVLANMILTMILIHSSAKRSLPFLYLEDLDETAKVQAESIIAYLKLLKE